MHCIVSISINLGSKDRTNHYMIYIKMIEKKKKKKISVKLTMADTKKNLSHWPLFPFLGSKKIYLKTKSESLMSDRWKAKSRYMSSSYKLHFQKYPYHFYKKKNNNNNNNKYIKNKVGGLTNHPLERSVVVTLPSKPLEDYPRHISGWPYRHIIGWRRPPPSLFHFILVFYIFFLI